MSINDTIQLVLLIALGQGVFLTIVLIAQKKGNLRANRLLAIAVFLMTYFTFVFLLNESGYRRYIPILILNGFSITPLIPVTFYFYFKQSLNDQLAKRWGLHLIPFLLQFVYWFPNNTNGLLFHLSGSDLAQYYSLTIVRVVGGIHILLFMVYFHVLFYRMTIPPEARWLTKIRVLYGILTFFFTMGLLSIWLSDTEVIRYAFFFFLSFFIYLIGYQGYIQDEKIFPQPKVTRSKYLNSSISLEESKRIYRTLIRHMENQKPFLDPNIKLSEIAHQIGTKPHHLSRAVNENYEGNFMDFVNKYRIDEAKSILIHKDTQTLKMLAVAMESGFGNKVSFYKSFRKFTGVLPSEFKSQHQQIVPSA